MKIKKAIHLIKKIDAAMKVPQKPFILIIILIAMFGIFHFAMGFHAIDLIFNYNTIASKVPEFDTSQWKESTIVGTTHTFSETYIIGVQQLFFGLLIICVSLITLAYTIGSLKLKDI